MTRRALLAALAATRKGWPFAFSFKGFPGWPLERGFALCRELGFTGVELHDPARLDARDASRLARQYRLPVLTIMEDLRLASDPRPQLERLEASLRLAEKLGKPLIETVVGGRPEEWPKLRGPLLEMLRGWTRLAERYRVPVAIKAHIGSALHLPEDAAGLCAEIGSRYLRLNYDYSHFQLQGLAMEATLRAALPYAAMLHIKDSLGEPPKHRFVLPGEGRIDYAAYTALLRQLGYRGPVVVEVSTHVLQQPGYDPEAAARKVARAMGPYFLL